MSMKERLEATAKNVQGKVQESVGEITGDPQSKAEGRAKQAEAAFQHSVENLKEEVKRKIN